MVGGFEDFTYLLIYIYIYIYIYIIYIYIYLYIYISILYIYIYIIRWSYGNLSMIATMVIYQAALGTLVDARLANAWGTRCFSLRGGKQNQRQSGNEVNDVYVYLIQSYTCRNKCRITLLHVELHTYPLYIYIYAYTHTHHQ